MPRVKAHYVFASLLLALGLWMFVSRCVDYSGAEITLVSAVALSTPIFGGLIYATVILNRTRQVLRRLHMRRLRFVASLEVINVFFASIVLMLLPPDSTVFVSTSFAGVALASLAAVESVVLSKVPPRI